MVSSVPARLALVVSLLVSLRAFAQSDPEAEAEFEVPSRIAAPPLSKVTSLAPAVDVLASAQAKPDGRLWAPREGTLEPLTIDLQLQKQLTDILVSYQTPYAAVVALEPSSGRVLAMAEHSELNPGLRGLCTKAVYPAASIFKLVTTTALLESGVLPDEQVCFSGGKRKVLETQLDDSQGDLRCLSLATALGHSANVAFAKLTAKYLDPFTLRSVARAFRFNTAISFPVPTEPSLAAIPDETYPFSLTGAGFGDVFLSPLHGAAMVAIAANQGLWRSPVLFAADAAVSERVMSTEVAEKLGLMMAETVTSGTARRIFAERGMRVPGAVGKTGSLADRKPFRDYTWFVGFAPREAPRIAVAAVIVNDPRWRIRATWLGREAMRLFLDRHRPSPSTSLGATGLPFSPSGVEVESKAP